ncbi:MAG: HEAT repeat domain-containing protein [Myxococcota bacterium]|nr:HEAT repeat domain-containing protein [Myxococcota bacterium]
MMEEAVFDALRSSDWSARVSALAALEKSIFTSQDSTELLALQVEIDDRFEEDDQIQTVEILILREYFCEAALAFSDEGETLTSHLFFYIQDRLPDTYPNPNLQEDGAHWSNPSKWKVRIGAAHALGVLGDASMAPLLETLLMTEPVSLVRRAMVLALSSLQYQRQAILKHYLMAYRDKDARAGKEAILILRTGMPESQQSYFTEILEEMGV